MLLTRVLTALIAGPLLVALIIWGPWWGFPAFTVLLVALALREFYAMTRKAAPAWTSALGVEIGALISASWLFMADPRVTLAVTSLGTIALLLAHLPLGKEMPLAAPRVCGSLGGLLFCVFPLTHLGLLYRLEPGWRLVVLVLLFTFAADTTAYFAGKTFGKHKFAPQVSPKKTWEGVVGGLAGGTAAVLAWRLVMPEMSVVDALILGIGATFVGQLGDLSESLIKRSTGVKDSGRLLPGHGGVLDRFDAVAFSAPLVYYYYLLFIAPGPGLDWLRLAQP